MMVLWILVLSSETNSWHSIVSSAAWLSKVSIEITLDTSKMAWARQTVEWLHTLAIKSWLFNLVLEVTLLCTASSIFQCIQSHMRINNDIRTGSILQAFINSTLTWWFFESPESFIFRFFSIYSGNHIVQLLQYFSRHDQRKHSTSQYQRSQWYQAMTT